MQANHNAFLLYLNLLTTVFIYINIQLCKQTTTTTSTLQGGRLLYLSISIYNFASKPQLYRTLQRLRYHCIYLYQYTTLQANHNSSALPLTAATTVFIYINIQLCKQTTTLTAASSNPFVLYLSISIYNFASKPQRLFIYQNLTFHCIYLYQYTTLQANHNSTLGKTKRWWTVFIYINIQLCKQTTTFFKVFKRLLLLYLSISIYNFASKPQLGTEQ